MAVSLGGVAAIGIGGALAYSGIANKGFLATIQGIVQGVAPSPILPGTATRTPGVPPGKGGIGNPNTPGAQANQHTAQALMPSYGWNSVQEFADLVLLWNRESGWSNIADTRQTGAGGDTPNSTVFAYGIAQARPATKYPKAGQPPDLGGQADAKTQIIWGMNYIRGRYGSPSGAWAWEQANGWY